MSVPEATEISAGTDDVSKEVIPESESAIERSAEAEVEASENTSANEGSHGVGENEAIVNENGNGTVSNETMEESKIENLDENSEDSHSKGKVNGEENFFYSHCAFLNIIFIVSLICEVCTSTYKVNTS